MKKLLTPIIIFFGLCQGAVAQEKSANATTEITTVAQEKSNLEMRGDKYFFVYSFDKAIDSYNQVNIDELTIEGERNVVEINKQVKLLKLLNATRWNLLE